MKKKTKRISMISFDKIKRSKKNSNEIISIVNKLDSSYLIYFLF